MKIFLRSLKKRVYCKKMETTKICKRLNNLSSDLKNSCSKDILHIFDIIFEEYDIVYKNTDKIVNKQILTDRLHNLLNEKVKEEIPVCKGFSQNGNKCFKRTQQNSNYCKVHAYLAFREKNALPINLSNNKIDTLTSNNIYTPMNLSKNKIDILSLEKTFINDSFYYHDKRFIYDKESLEKVGYVENENDFILTDDPFILEIL